MSKQSGVFNSIIHQKEMDFKLNPVPAYLVTFFSFAF